MEQHAPTSRARRLFVWLFLASLFLPFGGLVLNWNVGVSLDEKRELAPLPALPSDAQQLAEFPGRMDSFVGDHFGFRRELNSLFNLMQLRLLAPKPSRRVVSGSDDWLFLGWAVGYARKDAPLSTKQLTAWAELIEAKRRWLARRGVRYLFTVAPNKTTIYGHHLPAELAPAATSALDQLHEALAGLPDSPVVDLKAVLSAKADEQQLYYRTDTHWNDAGALLAAQALIERAAVPGVRVPAWNEFSERKVSGLGRDLARMLGLQYALTEQEVQIVPASERAARRILDKGYLGRVWKRYPPQCFTGPAGSTGSAVIVGDSFVMSTSLATRLAECFAQTVAVHRDMLDPDSPTELGQLLDEAQPDLVVEELVERELLRFKPDPAPFQQALAAP